MKTLTISLVRKHAEQFGTKVLSSRCPSPKTLLTFSCPACGSPFQTNWNTFRKTKNGRCQSCNKPVGSRNGSYKNLSPEERAARHTPTRLALHRIWEKAVFSRDQNRCTITGLPATPRRPLTAHHLENWADNPALRDDPSNGVTVQGS